jgi:hypothetical protein
VYNPRQFAYFQVICEIRSLYLRGARQAHLLDHLHGDGIRVEDEYAGTRAAFLLPLFEGLRWRTQVEGVWSLGGPWR